MEQETRGHLKRSLHGSSGIVEIPKLMAEITIFTPSRSLQGQEIREKLDTTFAKLYHDLDDGFQPINFMLPWMLLPQNRRRDVAQRKMTQIYTDIIRERRADSKGEASQDMLWNLMRSVYKDGTPLPEHEIAHMMIALLMAGQHSLSVTSSWTMLRLASEPQIMEDLYQEQLRVLRNTTEPLTYDNLQELLLVRHIIKDTLRIHPPIHSIMRKVTNPLPVEGTNFTIPSSHVVLAAPGFMSLQLEYFPDPNKWDPHRWENMTEPVEDEKHKEDEGYGLVSTGTTNTYLTFGVGRYRCIGEHFAYLQITVIVAIMVKELELRNLEGKEGVVATNYSVGFSIARSTVLLLIGFFTVNCFRGQWHQHKFNGRDGDPVLTVLIHDSFTCYQQ